LNGLGGHIHHIGGRSLDFDLSDDEWALLELGALSFSVVL
jgi:hypothetical protein